MMFDTSFKKLKTVLFFLHSIQCKYSLECFLFLVLIFLFLHQCQSKLIYVKGLFIPFYTRNKNFKSAFQKKKSFFSLSVLKKSEF